LIQLSENTNNCKNALNNSESNLKETAFNESAGSGLASSSAPQKTLTRQISSDPKLEKKVTFARLLSKMSAEIHNGSEIDVSWNNIFIWLSGL
jgi:hypothetical protein